MKQKVYRKWAESFLQVNRFGTFQTEYVFLSLYISHHGSWFKWWRSEKYTQTWLWFKIHVNRSMWKGTGTSWAKMIVSKFNVKKTRIAQMWWISLRKIWFPDSTFGLIKSSCSPFSAKITYKLPLFHEF